MHWVPAEKHIPAKIGNNPVVAAWGEEVPLLNTASKPRGSIVSGLFIYL
jgi:hypothetical protein